MTAQQWITFKPIRKRLINSRDDETKKGKKVDINKYLMYGFLRTEM